MWAFIRGALSTIAAMFYYDKYNDIKLTNNIYISNVTFGSPRVGDSKFVEQFSNTKIENMRIVYGTDPIPCLPTDIRYQHVEPLYWLDDDQIKSLSTPLKRYVKIFVSLFKCKCKQF